MSYTIRRHNTIVCQLDGRAFPFHDAASKEAARLSAQAWADSIIFAQTQTGVRPDATLTERKQFGGWQ